MIYSKHNLEIQNNGNRSKTVYTSISFFNLMVFFNYSCHSPFVIAGNSLHFFGIK